MHALPRAHSLAALLGGTALLALAVNLVELLCTAGLPALYTAVLAQQQPPPALHHAYLGLYIVGYIADDSLMVASAVAALGAVLMLRPHWLLGGS